MNNGNSQNYSIRGQINYDGIIDEIHQITALAGMEFVKQEIGRMGLGIMVITRRHYCQVAVASCRILI